MKKKVIVPIGLVLVALAVWGLSQFVRLPFLPVHPHAAIPSHTALFFGLEKSQLQAIANDDMPAAFSEIFAPQIMREDLIAFEALFGGQLVLPENKTSYVTVNPTRNFGVDLLFILPESRGVELNELLQNIKNVRVRSTEFQSVEVFSVNQRDEAFSFARFRNILLMARHAYLVENAILQLKSPSTSICKNSQFKQLTPSNKSSDECEIYLNINELGAQFAPLVEPEELNRIKRLSSFAHFVQIDFPFENEATAFSVSLSPNRVHPLLQANQSAQKIELTKALPYLPDDLTGFLSLSLTPLQKGPSGFAFSEWMGTSLTLAVGEKIGTQPAEKFLLLEAKNPKKAENRLEAVFQKSGKSEAFEFQMFTLWPIDGKGLSEHFGLGDFFEKTYACVLGDYVLFGNSKSGMERWLVKYMAGQTFSKQVAFLESIALSEPQNQAYFYFESRSAWQVVSHFLSERRGDFFRRNPFIFNHLSGTWNWEGENMLSNIKLHSGKAGDGSQAGILWQTPLLGKASGQPVISQNPYSGEREILVKDDLQNLYLLSNNGRIIWQRKFDTPILSKIAEIDLKGDDRRQFVLNTSQAIFVLDDDGADMPGYPLELQVPATNEVTVVDFFQSNDYHFFVACENGNVYGLDERGSPIEGWRPMKNIGEVIHPLLHFQANGMDFLAVLNIEGDLKVFQKNGKYRFPKVALEQPFLQQLDYQSHPRSSRIVTCDDTGRAYAINFKGDYFKLNLKVGENEQVKFHFSDIIGDDRKDYVVMSGSQISTYFYEENAFEKGWRSAFPMPQDGLFSLNISGSSKDRIGTYSEVKKRIFLLDEKGKVHENFPLEGTTPFLVEDLLLNGKKVVVTGNGRRVCAYSI